MPGLIGITLVKNIFQQNIEWQSSMSTATISNHRDTTAANSIDIETAVEKLIEKYGDQSKGVGSVVGIKVSDTVSMSITKFDGRYHIESSDSATNSGHSYSIKNGIIEKIHSEFGSSIFCNNNIRATNRDELIDLIQKALNVGNNLSGNVFGSAEYRVDRINETQDQILDNLQRIYERSNGKRDICNHYKGITDDRDSSKYIDLRVTAAAQYSVTTYANNKSGSDIFLNSPQDIVGFRIDFREGPKSSSVYGEYSLIIETTDPKIAERLHWIAADEGSTSAYEAMQVIMNECDDSSIKYEAVR